MKTKIHIGLLVFLFFYFAGAGTVLSQSTLKGTLEGRIIGSDTKKALPYATVMIVGTNNGAAADAEGNYIIRNVEAGRQEISVSYVGYETKKVSTVIKANESNKLDIALKISFVKGQEVVISSQRAGQQSAINEQINSKDIVSIVAPDRLQENPDANAAEAIGRLPGISLVRSGGEGQAVVIRGLDPKYSMVEIDGIQVPSTSSTDRSTNIAGISQYALQGVEVFKTLTPDMDGNATAGTINLQLNEAPKGFHYNLMAQGGYNYLNNDLKNYKFQVDLSDRVFDDKLGILLDMGSERVNRSSQNMTSDYGILSTVTPNGQFPSLYVNDINLTDNIRINYRSSATLVLDYKYAADSKLVFSNFFSHSSQAFTGVLKGFDLHDATRNVTYLFNQNLGNGNELYMSSLKGENKLDFINLSYGVAFSQTHDYTPNSRSWYFIYAAGVPSAYTDTSKRSLPLGTIVNAINNNYLSSTQGLQNTILEPVGVNSEDDMDRIVSTYFDAKINWQLDNNTSAYIKFGAKYKSENKSRYYSSLSANLGVFPQFGDTVTKYISWVDVIARALTANGFQNGNLNNFLGGQYNFGWYPNFDRLNQLMDWYSSFSTYYKAHPNIGASAQMFLQQDITGQQANNYKFSEKYLGTYLMGELDLGKMITFIPGVRYEKVTDDLNGWWAIQIPYPQSPYGHPATATHNDEYFLPDAHLIIRPNDWMHIHFSYTNSLNRPDYFSLVPLTYIVTSGLPQILNEGNPDLKPEHWTNYDLQIAFYNNEIGYLGVNGFYKIAKDVIWTPVHVRMPGDPLPAGFENIFQQSAVVNITQPVNMDYPVFLKGLELEWQTSFWYLPKPFSYFSLYANYTLMNSSTKYPRYTTLNEQVGTDSRGRPIYKLITTYYVDNGSMVNQPDNIANLSLGYNYEGLNVWLSYEFSGQKLAGFNPQPELSTYDLSFQRYDLQITQKLPIKNLEALFNFANINNPTDISKLSGDPRPNYSENYGWTMDLGLRYNL